MHSLETEVIGQLSPHTPTLVFLHEGLGSVSGWRDFPQQVCEACGIAGILYSRTGYGQSPEFDGPLDLDFMHREASRDLPAIINHYGLEAPILFGHSDGGSIALIHAAQFTDQPRAPLAVIVMAPHLFVEPVCIEAIAQLRQQFDTDDRLQMSLSRYHHNPVTTFNTWTQAWLNPIFSAWDIREEASNICCPVLAIQGFDDQYGTMAQLDELASRAPQVELLKLTGCGHSPQRDQPTKVLHSVQAFVSAQLAAYLP
ncbi:MAG: alpha/beta hydrolase [Burkholderiaceae bacterium]